MSARPPRVSVCIANFNGERLLADCIDSVLAQQARAAIDIIVHDDASSDGSLELLRTRYPGVRVMASDENVGFCIANNRMAELACGDFLLLLNNDAALFPNAVATLLDAVAKPGGNRSIHTLPQFAWDDGRLINLGCLLDPFYNAVPILDSEQGVPAMVEGACMFLSRDLWRETGGFPDWFGSIAEDALLCCAARLAGVDIRCAPGSGYRHRQGASFGGNRIDEGRLRTRFRRRRLSERNRIALLVSCSPTWIVWPWLALHLVSLLAECAALCMWARSLRTWREIYAPALLGAWQNRFAIHALRMHVQAHRRMKLRQYLSRFVVVPARLRLVFRHGLPEIGE